MSRPTIIDVARHAGVSKSLVSLVLRNAPNVSAEKRQAVHRAIDELGYQPNAVARSLVRQRSFLLGVVLADLHNPFFADLIDGVDEATAEAGYRSLIDASSQDISREERAIETLLQLRVDGLILMGATLPISPVAAAGTAVPVVMIGRASRAATVDTVVNDDRSGAGQVISHLSELGHRRITHLAGSGQNGSSRRRAYERAMADHGLAGEARVVPGDWTEDGGLVAGSEALADHRPTAIFAANDLTALGALEAIARAGLRVPEDVSLVGYDNTSIAALHHISLTTVEQPRHLMGRTAVQLLLERIDEGRTEARRVVVQPEMVVRRTTGPPRSEA